MKGEPDIIADVHFFATDEGGRKGPTPAELFGCPFEFEGEKFDCRIFLSGVGPLAPGSKAKVPIAFLYPNLIKPRLKAGSHFTLWELKTIAEGVVEQVMPNHDSTR